MKALGAVFAALAVVGYATAVQGAPAPGTPRAPAPAFGSCPSSVRGLGLIAFAAQGRLEVVDLADCTITTLAKGAAGDVRFSADQRWLAFSRTVAYRPPAVPRARPWAAACWRGHGRARGRFCTASTALASCSPGAPEGKCRCWRAVSKRRTRRAPRSCPRPMDASSRSTARSARARRTSSTRSRSGAGRAGSRSRARTARPPFSGWSPDGRWLLYWQNGLCSASIAADGLALKAAPASGAARPRTAIGHMLLYRDYLSWCGRRLIAAVTPSRETQLHSALVETGPPAWRQRTIQQGSRLSWVSPACSPSGKLLAAAAGPSTQDSEFGVEHRSIWLLARDGKVVRQLTSPPASRLSDEAPRFSRDGRWILFVRSGVRPNGSRDTIELMPVDAAGAPVAIVEFKSGDFSYYDHFDWPTEIAWSAAADTDP